MILRVRPLVVCFLLVSVLSVDVALARNAFGSERDLLAATNRERRTQGLPALRWDQSLAVAARAHAREMAKHESISHQFSGEPSLPSRARQAGAQFTWLAENVDSAGSASQINDRFLHSSAHRANILDQDMDSIGIGVVERGGQLFAVEDFSKAK